MCPYVVTLLNRTPKFCLVPIRQGLYLRTKDASHDETMCLENRHHSRLTSKDLCKQSLIKEKKTLMLTSPNVCISTPILKLEMTICVIRNS